MKTVTIFIHTNMIENGKHVVIETKPVKLFVGFSYYLEKMGDFVQIEEVLIRRDLIAWLEKYEVEIPEVEDEDEEVEEPFLAV